MGLFKPDLYRAFGMGFALGTVALLAAMGAQGRLSFSDQVIPAAVAAPVHADQTQ
jgi:hypothetical protein